MSETLSRKECLTRDQLVKLVTGKEDVHAEVTSHLEQCKSCKQLLLEAAGADQIPTLSNKGDDTSVELKTLIARMRELGVPSSVVDRPAGVEPAAFASGDELRHFVIKRKLGQGGFAEVYLAEDTVLDRRVALKIPFADHLRDSVARERFRREAKSVATLSHPNIVPLFEIIDDGERLFLASEYCEGESLADYLRGHPDGLFARTAVAIVSRIAEAVQYSHSRGIVHRDLKPSNIILANLALPEEGAEQASNRTGANLDFVPRLLDFGLARNLSSEATISIAGEVAGTPANMSPEQARGDARVGPASDIFSLGTLLFTLLSGKNPFYRNDFLASLKAVESTDLGESKAALSGLPRDLRAIIETCLQEDCQRRYSSAHALAEDLNAWLDSRPITARRATVLERLQRWTRRQPATAAAVGIAFAALAIGAGLTTWKWLEAAQNLQTANEESVRAEENLLAANQALTKAEEARARAETILTFLSDTYRKPKPGVDGRDVKVVDLLARAESEIADQFAEDLETRIALLQQIGNTYVGLGLLEDGIRVLEGVRGALNEAKVPPDDNLLSIIDDLGVAHNNLSHLDEALELAEEQFDVAAHLHGRESEQAMLAVGNKAQVLMGLGKRQEAIPLLEEAIAFFESHNGTDGEKLLAMQGTLGMALTIVGDQDQKQQGVLLLKAVVTETERLFGEDYPDTLLAKNYYANALMQIGSLDNALEVRRDLYKATARLMGPGHDQTLMTLNNLAATYNMNGQPQEAIETYEILLPAMKEKYTEQNPLYLLSLRSLANIYREQEDFETALPLYEQCYQGLNATIGLTHPRNEKTQSEFASVSEALGLWSQAAEVWMSLAANGQGAAAVSARLRGAVAEIRTGNVADGLEVFEASLAELADAEMPPQARQLMESMARQRVTLALLSQAEFDLARKYVEELSQRELVDTKGEDRLLTRICQGIMALAKSDGASLDVSAEEQARQAVEIELDASSLKYPMTQWIKESIGWLLDHSREASQPLSPDTTRELQALRERTNRK